MWFHAGPRASSERATRKGPGAGRLAKSGPGVGDQPDHAAICDAGEMDLGPVLFIQPAQSCATPNLPGHRRLSSEADDASGGSRSPVSQAN